MSQEQAVQSSATAQTPTKRARAAVARKTSAPAKVPAKVPAKTAVKRPVAVKRAIPAKAPAAKTPSVKAPVKATTPVVEAANKPEPKPKKIKLIRDSFTMPESEYVVLAAMKKICIKAGVEIKKGELLRVAVNQLQSLSPKQISEIKEQLVKVIAGRPKN
jgi:hypothetical protein